jgi:hypothetical protein
MTGQDTGIALREVRVALNLLDLLAYAPRIDGVPNALLPGGGRGRRILQGVPQGWRRLPAPSPLLMTMDRARRALGGAGDDETRLQLLHALSGLRLALLPGVEFVGSAELEEPLPMASMERLYDW